MSDAQDKSVQKMMRQFCEHCGNEVYISQHVYCQDAYQRGAEDERKKVELLHAKNEQLRKAAEYALSKFGDEYEGRLGPLRDALDESISTEQKS
jgi:hypothetical protein